jgi:hypothetical protein
MVCLAFWGTVAFRWVQQTVTTRLMVATLLPAVIVMTADGVIVNYGVFPQAFGTEATVRMSGLCSVISWWCGVGIFAALTIFRSKSFNPVLLWLGRVSSLCVNLM